MPTSLNICSKALPIGTNILLATQPRRKWANKPQHMLQSSTHWNKYTPCDTAAEEMGQQASTYAPKLYPLEQIYSLRHGCRGMCRQASIYAPKLYPLEQIYSLRHSCGGNVPTSLNICSKALPIGTNILLATQLWRKCADKPQYMLQSSTHWNKYTPCQVTS